MRKMQKIQRMQKNENAAVTPESYIQRLGGLTALNEHEPPIGVGGGQLFVDIPRGLILVDPQPGHGPYVYTFARDAGADEVQAGDSHPDETEYTGISALLTVTENDGGYVDVVTYSTSNVVGTKLHIWFGDDTNPDFILEVSGTVRQLTISSRLDPPIPNPSKSHRPNRRICSARAIIKKWELVGSSGAVIQDPITGAMLEDYNDDDYHFYISFAHEHQHHEEE